jgi:DNA-binding NarL/FixJ family response regulator
MGDDRVLEIMGVRWIECIQMSSEQLDNYNLLYLVGSDNFSHEALQYALEKKIQVKCTLIKNGDSILLETGDTAPHKVLVLINCLEKNFEAELNSFGFYEKPSRERVLVALFNLQRGTGIERKAFHKGVTGFFYRSDSLSHMVKGIQALFQGEIWVAREILVEVALKSQSRKIDSNYEKTALTKREVEILALVSIGASNEEIGEKLFISPHTVKTHLYRIFQKIKVPNRFQAALWAAKNL